MRLYNKRVDDYVAWRYGLYNDGICSFYDDVSDCVSKDAWSCVTRRYTIVLQ